MTAFKLVLEIRALHSHGLPSIETRGVNREQINFEDGVPFLQNAVCAANKRKKCNTIFNVDL